MPDYSLAVWHGFNAPLLMSLIATRRRHARLRLLRRRAAAAPCGLAPLLPALRRRALFERVAGLALTAPPDVLARGSARAGCSRSCSLIVVIAVLVAACLGAARRRLTLGRPAAAARRRPEFALLWVIGVACAVGAAWQAKFHRLAALILMGVRRPRAPASPSSGSRRPTSR